MVRDHSGFLSFGYRDFFCVFIFKFLPSVYRVYHGVYQEYISRLSRLSGYCSELFSRLFRSIYRGYRDYREDYRDYRDYRDYQGFGATITRSTYHGGARIQSLYRHTAYMWVPMDKKRPMLVSMRARGPMRARVASASARGVCVCAAGGCVAMRAG